MQVKNDMVVLNLFKKSQEKWSHLTTQDKKFNDTKLVIMYYICHGGPENYLNKVKMVRICNSVIFDPYFDCS